MIGDETPTRILCLLRGKPRRGTSGSPEAINQPPVELRLDGLAGQRLDHRASRRLWGNPEIVIGAQWQSQSQSCRGGQENDGWKTDLSHNFCSWLKATTGGRL